MTRLALAFFSAAALCAVVGMVMGVVMAASHDHTLTPAHAHLNLVGWASLALMGGFYQLSGRSGRLGWLNFVLSTLSVAVITPTLSLLLRGEASMERYVSMASMMALAGMVVFLWVVLSSWKTARAA
jgi:hypothetical protein